jgi:hypothetical protein
MTIYSYLLPGKVPALKNNRDPILGKGGSFHGTRPAAEIEKYIRVTKDKIRRQRPDGYAIPESPVEVAFVAMIGVLSVGYPNTLPKSDLDNAATTLQESMFTAKSNDGPLIQDDRQVADYHITRLILRDDASLYSRLWVWEYELLDFSQHRRNMRTALDEMYDEVERNLRQILRIEQEGL